MRLLIAGWFSFEEMGATAGDLIVRDLVRRWVLESGHHCDLALAPPFSGGVDWRRVDPESYDRVVFACGPFGNGWPLTEFLERFRGRPLVGLDLSMLQALEEWNPFELLIERDSDATARPDLAFLGPAPRLPVVAVVLAHRQNEYGERARHEAVHEVLQSLLDEARVAPLSLDTRLDVNAGGLSSAEQVETLIARADAVVTTRLHGLVLALKNGVPPLVVDPVAGGAKLSRQAEVLGWPVLFTPERLEPSRLRAGLEHCLSPAGRLRAVKCAGRAREQLHAVRESFLDALRVEARDRVSPR